MMSLAAGIGMGLFVTVDGEGRTGRSALVTSETGGASMSRTDHRGRGYADHIGFSRSGEIPVCRSIIVER